MEGSLPPELQGTFFRVGPARFATRRGRGERRPVAAAAKTGAAKAAAAKAAVAVAVVVVAVGEAS